MNVATGRARAGWYTSARGLGLSWEGQGNDDTAIAEGKSQGSFKKKLTGKERYILLINSVKYILFLEYGHSNQAPHGMVRINMRKLTGDKMPKEMGKEMQKEWKKF